MLTKIHPFISSHVLPTNTAGLVTLPTPLILHPDLGRTLRKLLLGFLLCARLVSLACSLATDVLCAASDITRKPIHHLQVLSRTLTLVP